MTTTPQSTSSTRILESARSLLRDGESLSLESVARAAGLTKPGLMYHFPTKEALMTGLVDHTIDGYERELVDRLPQGSEEAGSVTVEQRLAAYVDWAFAAEIDQCDLVMFSDPRLRDHLTARWSDRLRVWVEVPGDIPPLRRARLHAARLMADGSWFADASGVLPLTSAERTQVAALARELLGDSP